MYAHFGPLSLLEEKMAWQDAAKKSKIYLKTPHIA
jgi:hypothetical protein